MREIDLNTLLIILVSWSHGLLCGWAIWRDSRKPTREMDE
jgi:hypothetical protein